MNVGRLPQNGPRLSIFSSLAGGLAVEPIHDLKIKPHYPAEITGFGEGSLVARRLANRATLPQLYKIPLEFYTEGIFCQ
jgi:hypothetical protein